MPKSFPSSIRRRIPAIGAVVSAILLSGCSVDPASLALSGVSVVTFTQTGKTLTDHAMSLATDQDCSLKHSLTGTPWCQPVAHTPAPEIQAHGKLHCYRSLAATTCYRQQNPHDTASRRSPSTPLTEPAAPGSAPSLALK